MSIFYQFSAMAIAGTLLIMAAFAEAETILKEKTVSEYEQQVRHITAEEIRRMQAQDTPFILIDARGDKYFDGTIIEGAINLPTDKMTEEGLAKLVAHKNDLIVFYCTNIDCPASRKSAYKAIDMGYTNVAKYAGGIEEWVSKDYPAINLFEGLPGADEHEHGPY